MAAAWTGRDVAAIAELFADDALFITPGGALRGRDAIASAAAAFFAFAGDVAVTITRALADGDQGAIEWTWREADAATGVRRTTEDAIVFELRDGKVIYWREYFDPAQTESL